MSIFNGSGVAIITPIKNEQINFDKLGELLEWHVKEGTDAIITCGTTGETTTMSELEQKEVIKFTVEKIAGRIPVIAGTGSNNSKHAIELSQYAESVGVDGLLVINPYYNKSTQKGIIAHFKAVASSVKIPIIIYNVPGRTGMNILPKTIKELSKIENIAGVKEASGNISQITEIARLCDSDFSIYSGNDDHVLPILSIGGSGVISVSANIIPKDMHNLVNSFLDGNFEESLKLQLKTNIINRALFIETNPIPVKTAMNILGFNVGDFRLPLIEMDISNITKLKDAMIEYGLNI